MLRKKPNIPKLREQLNSAIQKDKVPEAIELCGQLALAEPNDPRWPQRKGDLYRRQKDDQRAIESYEAAVELYAKQGFVARAAAMAKLILQIAPSRLDILERVDPDEARRLHRQQRNDLVTALPVQPSASPPAPATPPELPSSDVLRAPAAPAFAPPPPRSAVPPLPSSPAAKPFAPPARPPLPPALAAPPPRAASPAAVDAAGLPPDSPPPPPARAPRKRNSLSISAIELQQVTEADDDELRFSDVEGDDVLEIDLSALEVEDSPSGSHGAQAALGTHDDEDDILFDLDEDDEQRRSALELAALPSISLFAEIPPAALSRLIQHADLVELGRGELLVRAGDPADALYVIVSGDLEVEWPGISAPIALGEGSVVGEACLLDAVTRRADVRTLTRVSALRIPKVVLDDIADEFPAVSEVLLELLTRRLISNLLRTNPLFAGFDADMRADLARLFEVRRATAGTAIFEVGKKTDGLYLPLLGRLDVLQEAGVLGRVRLGTVFGQNALLTRTPAEYSVVATTDVIVLRLPATRFNELAAHYPTALMHLSELSDSVDGQHISIIPGAA